MKNVRNKDPKLENRKRKMKGKRVTSFSEKPGSMNLKNMGNFFWDISGGDFLGPSAMHLNNVEPLLWGFLVLAIRVESFVLFW